MTADFFLAITLAYQVVWLRFECKILASHLGENVGNATDDRHSGTFIDTDNILYLHYAIYHGYVLILFL